MSCKDMHFFPPTNKSVQFEFLMRKRTKMKEEKGLGGFQKDIWATRIISAHLTFGGHIFIWLNT